MLRKLLFALVAASPAFAGEYAVLSTGFRIHAERHEVDGPTVRLFTQAGMIEVPATSVSNFEDEEYVAPIAVVVVPPVPPPPPKSTDPKTLVREAAVRNSLPPAFVASVAKAESAMKQSALSPKGAIGVMQLMPQTAARFGVTNAADPIENLLGAARFLTYLQQSSGRPRALPEVIAAYNAGEGAVAHYRGIPPYAETQNYVRKVLIAYLSQPPPAPNHTKSIRLPARGNYSAADAPAEEKADPFRQLELIQRGRAQAANAAHARSAQAARK